MEQGIYGRNLDDYLAAAGLKKSDMSQVPGHRSKVGSWRLEGQQIDIKGVGKEFPGLMVSEKGTRCNPGAPMVFEYEIHGPADQVQAFAQKYWQEKLRGPKSLT